MDVNIQDALVFREQMAMQATNYREKHPCDDPQMSKAFAAALRSSQVVIWTEEALTAFTDFWKQESNRKRLDDLVYVKHDTPVILRIVKDLCRNYFHFCPKHTWTTQPEFIPAQCDDPAGAVTQVFAYLFYQYKGITEFCCAQMPAYRDMKKYNRAIAEFAAKHGVSVQDVRNILNSNDPEIAMPLRYRLMQDSLSTSLVDYHLPMHGDAKEVDDFITCGWLYTSYQFLIFLEQPYVGLESRRIKKHEGPRHSVNKDERVQVIYLRKRQEGQAPKIVIPHVSQVTGRTLTFEHDVSGYTRRSPLGKIVRVQPYKRGPRGVIRARVIKATR